MGRNPSHCAPVQSSLGATSPLTRALRRRKNVQQRKGRFLKPTNASDSSRDIATLDGNQDGEKSFAAATAAATGSSFTVELQQPSNLESQARSYFFESMQSSQHAISISHDFLFFFTKIFVGRSGEDT
jgi:hypothetical protein